MTIAHRIFEIYPPQHRIKRYHSNEKSDKLDHHLTASERLMFIILTTYLKPMEIVNQHLADHRAYLETCYQRDLLVASGPQNPRTGGILISQLTDKQQVLALIEHDPFNQRGIASYECIEFDPVKYHKNFASFISTTAAT